MSFCFDPNKQAHEVTFSRIIDKKDYPPLNFINDSESEALREKCPNTEFFLVRIFPYSARIWENTEQKKLRIGTLFMQWS